MLRAWRALASGTRLIALLCMAVVCAGGITRVHGQTSLELKLGELVFAPAEGQVVVARGVLLTLPGAGKQAVLDVEALQLPGHALTKLRLTCGRQALADGTLRCEDGHLVADGLPSGAHVMLDMALDGSRLSLSFRHAVLGQLDVAYAAGTRLRLNARALQLAALAPFLPGVTRGASGQVDLALDYRESGQGPQMSLEGRITDGRFSSADGLQAAEALSVTFSLEASARGDVWRWQGTAGWNAGEVYLHPFYLQAGPVLEAAGLLNGDVLSVKDARVRMDGVDTLLADAEIGLAPLQLRHARLNVGRADLATIGPRWIAPLLRPGRADGLLFSGRADARLELRDAVPVAADIVLDQIAIRFVDEDIAFGPVSGRIPWHREHPGRASLEIAGGQWQKLSLGAFVLDAALAGNAVRVADLDVPVMDGRLRLRDLAVVRGADGWSGEGRAELAPISMTSLADALGWPAMTGEVSAVLPGLRITPSEVRLDGALDVSVFDGRLTVSKLALFEPFSAASHLAADVRARNLDLGQLTETFSFGGMTGRVDVDVVNLELVDWTPTQFDASLRSAAGDYPRRISQRAVQNISALGGAGAMAALQRGFLGIFESFGYREIALSCILRAGVCEMAGLPGAGAEGGGFRIVRGGGVPALDVMGYNRRVDWADLVGRVRAVIASNMTPVIE